jgi:hypothetical protein
MANWKKIITSGSNAHLNQITGSGGIKGTIDTVTQNSVTTMTGLTSVGTIGTGTWQGTAINQTYLVGQSGTNTGDEDQASVNALGITEVGTISTGVWEGTDVGVQHGGTGVGTLTDGGVLLGSGTGAITAMSVLTDGQMIVGDGSGDPVAESGATLRTSIGVGTTDNVEFAHITGSNISASGDLSAGGDLVLSGGTFTSASLAEAIANDGDITGVDLTGQSGGITIDSETNTTSGNYTANIQLPTALTVPQTIYNTALKIGRASGDTYIDFATADDNIDFYAGATKIIDLTTSGIDVTGTITSTGNVTVGGDLTVNGTTTTVATTNTEMKDQFLFLASGSQTSNVDAGIIVQSGSVAGSGSALYFDNSDQRWSIANGIAKNQTAAVGSAQFVTTVATSTSSPSGDGVGVGSMWVDTNEDDGAGNGTIYIRTS